MAPWALTLLDLEAIIHASGATWTPAPNPISRLNEEEKLLRTGGLVPTVIPAPNEREEAARAQATSGVGAVGYPAAVDWRNTPNGNFVTPVRDEGSCCACMAFAAAATVESAMRIARGNPTLAVDYSEAHLLFCYGRQAGATCSGGGWWLSDALNAFETGVVDEACFPYTGGNQACTLCGDWQSRLTYITGWHEISSLAAMKEWIATRGPVATWMSVYGDFFSYSAGVYRHVTGPYYGRQCVTIVGYSDADQCWIAKNCWSTGWGEAGFFRIGYGECGIDAAMFAVDGVEETTWRRRARITAGWSIDQDRNVWVFVDQVGWRKVAPDSDVIVLTMTAQLSAARAGRRSVDLFDDRGIIKQVYVY